MKRFYLLALLLVGLMTACQKEDFVSVSSDPGFDVTASMEAMVETRTQLVPGSNGNYKMVWSANDAISVFSDGCHWKYYVKGENAGGVNAKLSFDPSFDSSISGGIENEGSADVFVAVYPFSEETVISKSGDDYVINTVIPTEQNFVSGSFGQNASLMVAVNALKPSYSFRNVGAVLCMPLKGEANIVSATLESAAHNIAGAAVVTAVAENDYDPIVSVENGVNKVALMFAEGVELSKDEATNFCFVLAPGTYEANDLKVTFYDNKGNYFESKITAANTFVRSQVLTFGVRTFSVTGTEKLNQKVVARAGAHMIAERIMPSLASLQLSHVREWAEALKTDPEASAKIKEAAAYVALKNYRAAFDILNGIPGFVIDSTTLRAYGIGECEIGSLGYLRSFVNDIATIKDIESLLNFFTEFEKVYEASGIKSKLNNAVFASSDYIENFIDQFIDAIVTQKPEDNVNDSEIFAEYKAAVKPLLDYSIDGALGLGGAKAAINTIDAALSAIKLAQKLSADAFATEKTELEGYKAQVQAYIAAASAISENWDNYTSKEALEKDILNLPKFKYSRTIDLGYLGSYPIEYEVDPSTFVTAAAADYAAKLAELIKENEGAIALLKAGYKTTLENLMGGSVVDALEKVTEDPDSITSKFLTTLFAQEQFLEIVRTSLTTIVEEIEQASKDSFDANNVLAFESAKENAIMDARTDAVNQVWALFDKANQENVENLYSGAWGYVKKLIDDPKFMDVFIQLGIQDVYSALVEFTKAVEEAVYYTKGSINYDKENFTDYKEGEDWWLITMGE